MKLVKRTKLTAGVVEVYDKAIPNPGAVLDAVIDRAAWMDARVGMELRRDESIRDNDVHWVSPFDFRNPTVLYDFIRTVWHYMDDYGVRYDRSFSHLENVNVNRYLPGQRYHAHADAGGDSRRVISALVYLNDDFTGGETEFVHFREKVTPKAGRLVLFPSDFAYRHAALPPTDGVKYSAAFWANA